VDQHVGAIADQLVQPFDLSRIGKVDRDAELRPVKGVECGRGPFGKRRPPAAAGVASLRILDLDDLSAELAEIK